MTEAEFKPIRIAVLTISDTRTKDTDTSGAKLRGFIESSGHINAGYEIAKDSIEQIRELINSWSADSGVDAIITTGGTGFTGRDVTPEAIRPLLDKEIEGFSAVFHMISFQKIGTSTIQSRAFAGISNNTYVFCLPGSPGACKDAWNGILKEQLDNRHKPCNFINIMPRLGE